MERDRRNRVPVVAFVVLMLAIGLVVPAAPAVGKERTQKGTRPPGNDSFAAREEIKALPFSRLVDGSRATLESGEPTCGGMTSSVWFTFTPRSNVDLVVEAVSETLGASVAAYVGEELAGLEQVGCSSASSGDDGPGSALFSFYAEQGTSYLFQVGPLQTGSDVVELKLSQGTSPRPFIGDPGALPHGWREKVLVDEERSHTSDGADLVRFEGRPSGDGSMYDMDVWVAGRHVVDRLSLYTGGTVRDGYRFSVLGASSHSLATEVKIRYDATGHRCLAGVGGDCKVLLPRGPEADDITSGKAERAELIVTVQVQRQASLVPIDPVSTTLRVPLVGYVAALLP